MIIGGELGRSSLLNAPASGASVGGTGGRTNKPPYIGLSGGFRDGWNERLPQRAGMTGRTNARICRLRCRRGEKESTGIQQRENTMFIVSTIAPDGYPVAMGCYPTMLDGIASIEEVVNLRGWSLQWNMEGKDRSDSYLSGWMVAGAEYPVVRFTIVRCK